MKSILQILLVTSFITACANDDKKTAANHDSLVKQAIADTNNFTTVKWLDTVFSFGTIKQGEKVSLKFRCLNTGNKPLVLTNVRPGCGCTVADYSKDAILPGKEGWVATNFDSKKFCGEVHKSVLATSNTSNDKERNLQFTGTIINCENDRVVQPHPVKEGN